VVPYIDVFLEDGRMKEEWKMGAESRRILGLPDLPDAATCVRVPEFVGHAEAVIVELERPLGAALNAVQIAEALVSRTGLHPRPSLLAIA
jgi:aspartate-semialdehyde dehydrogenase